MGCTEQKRNEEGWMPSSSLISGIWLYLMVCADEDSTSQHRPNNNAESTVTTRAKVYPCSVSHSKVSLLGKKKRKKKKKAVRYYIQHTVKKALPLDLPLLLWSSFKLRE